MKRFFLTLDELRTMLYSAYPAMGQVKWVDDALRELWEHGTPSPRSWNYRMIKPSDWRQFAHDVGRRIGQEVHASPSQ